MRMCKNHHAEIVHDGNSCPVCIELEKGEKKIMGLEEDLDEQEQCNIEQEGVVTRLRKELSEALSENAELKQTLENAVNNQ